MDQLDELRGRMRDAEIQTGKLWTAHRELATVVWGDDRARDNGLRSRVVTLENRVDVIEEEDIEMSARLSHYLDVERLDTCHGLKGLAAHENMHEETEERHEQSKTQLAIARIQAFAQIWGPIMTFAGIVYLAVQK